MQNILARNAFQILFLFLFLRSLPAFAITPDEIAATVKNSFDKLTETSKLLYEPDPANERGKMDPFFEKIKKNRESFFKKQRERQKKFFEKMRNKNWDQEKLQKELNQFHQKQKERIDQFMEKQQKKIDKHTAKQNS